MHQLIFIIFQYQLKNFKIVLLTFTLSYPSLKSLLKAWIMIPEKDDYIMQESQKNKPYGLVKPKV